MHGSSRTATARRTLPPGSTPRTVRADASSPTALLVAASLALVSLLAGGCGSESDEQTASATKVSSRHQLVGGIQALGEVGDYRLRNGEIRAVIQNEGFNRGSGLFGGSLIDADLTRVNQQGDIYGGNGNDTLGEVFPAFFLEAINPEQVRVSRDGSDGGAAAVEVTGRGGEFVTMLRYLNQAIVNSYRPESLGDLLGDAFNNPEDLQPPNSAGRPLAEFSTEYVLEPGARTIRMKSTIRNNDFETIEFPGETLQDNENILRNQVGIDISDFVVPTGQVLGFGEANSVFVPGIGFNIRFGLEEAISRDIEFPAFPGKLAPYIATANPDGINYGFFTERSVEENFACNRDCCQLEGERREACLRSDGEDVSTGETELFYGGRADPDDVLFLFDAAGFAGVFTHRLPDALAPNHCSPETPAEEACDDLLGECETDECEENKQACVDGYDSCLDERESLPSKFSYKNYFVVGDGSVSSIVDEFYRLRGRETRSVNGRIFDELSGDPVGSNVELLLYRPLPEAESPEAMCSTRGSGEDRREPTIFNQTYTNSAGYFDLQLPPGEYCYRIRESGRPLTEYRHFEVGDRARFLRLRARSTARIDARITDASGRPMPAKLSVVGTHEFRGDTEKREFVYDLEAGETWRTSDLRPDDPDDPSTRRFIEAVAYSSADGDIDREVRPGNYILSFSRGPEYERETRRVDLDPGAVERVNVELEKVVETPNHVSGDFHMHAQGSIDSDARYTDRVISIAAEDVDVVVSSDHNFVSDFQPFIRREGLDRWMTSFVGVELTTFEFGHFNAFPVDFDVGSINRGSIRWQREPPQTIFDRLRERGSLSPEETIIQVNHPRDSILGYFSQFSVDGFEAKSSFPLDFDESSGPQGRLTTRLTMPSGDAFVRDCRPDSVNCCPDGGDCGEEEIDFESTYSWDFDALEIFNGKRKELNRHFRVPYDEESWPRPTGERLLRQICTEDDDCEDPAELVRDRCCSDGFASPVDDQPCENGGSSREACPVWEKQREFLAERYPEDAVVCEDGEVAFPGGLDDWYNTLNYARPFVENRPGATQSDDQVYKRITATGNSDSHTEGEPNLSTPGHPRNYVRVGSDEPQQVSAAEVSEALRNQRNIVTNGPFFQMRVRGPDDSEGDGARVGGQIRVDSDETTIDVSIRAADWVGADRFRIIANGEPLKSLRRGGEAVESDDRGWVSFELGDDGAFAAEYRVSVERDTWFVLEVEGDNNLFPVYPPSEIPRLPFDEIIGEIAGSFGFGGAGALEPSEVFPLTPFGFSNPIWVVRDGPGDDDGKFTPPEPEPAACEEGVVAPEALSTHSHEAGDYPSTDVNSRLDTTDLPGDVGDDSMNLLSRPRGTTRDVRTLFRQFGHGH